MSKSVEQIINERIDFLIKGIVKLRGFAEYDEAYWIEKDKHQIYEFCDVMGIEPEPYIKRYNEGVKK